MCDDRRRDAALLPDQIRVVLHFVPPYPSPSPEKHRPAVEGQASENSPEGGAGGGRTREHRGREASGATALQVIHIDAVKAVFSFPSTVFNTLYYQIFLIITFFYPYIVYSWLSVV